MEVGVQMYKNKVVDVTGDGHGIGLATRMAFEAAGARVYGIDLNPGSFYLKSPLRKPCNSLHG